MLLSVQHTLAKILARQARVFRGMALNDAERAEADHFARAIENADNELAKKRPQQRAVNFARSRHGSPHTRE